MRDTSRVDEQSAVAVFDNFVNGRLDKGAWTHEAHLITCWVALRDRSPAEALTFLRDAIQTHNCGVSIRNSDIGGYHETLTVYYVTAVAEAASPTIEALFDVPSCGRDAALGHWSREILFGTKARLGWIEPDIAPLPWDRQFDAALAGTIR